MAVGNSYTFHKICNKTNCSFNVGEHLYVKQIEEEPHEDLYYEW